MIAANSARMADRPNAVRTVPHRYQNAMAASRTGSNAPQKTNTLISRKELIGRIASDA